MKKYITISKKGRNASCQEGKLKLKQLKKANISLAAELKKSKKREELLLKKVEEAKYEMTSAHDFFSTLSHELRTPMHAVIGLTNILLLENPNERQMEHLNSLAFSSNNLLNLINDILDFNKLDKEKMELEEAEFDLVGLLRDLEVMLQGRLDHENKDVRFILDIEEGIPDKLIGDILRITQVLNNLITNAIKFTDKGWIKVTLKINYITQSGITIGFQIEDTGIGIPKDKQKRIFNAFEQAELGTSRQYGGTGLGLAISKKILSVLNSEIFLESEEGKGATFSFSIRFKVPKSTIETKKKADDLSNMAVSPQHFEGFKVLIAEDNEINQGIARSFMTYWSIQHKIVDNGAKAVQEVMKNDYDLILMDIQMPEMDGFEATKNIRKIEGENGRVPIVALSASTLGEDMDKSVQVGMNQFLPKPFKMELFFDVLNKYNKKRKKLVTSY